MDNQHLLAILRHVPSGNGFTCGGVALVRHTMLTHRTLSQCRIGVAHLGKLDIDIEQRLLIILLLTYRGYATGYILINLIRICRFRMITPQHGTSYIFITLLFGAIHAQLFAVVDVGLSSCSEQHGCGQFLFSSRFTQLRSRTVFIVVTQLGSLDVVGAISCIKLLIAQDVLGKVATGAVVDSPLQAIPKVKLEKGG